MRYITLHGHFYQPPRENAWLEEIEIQESAWPWHDWNERITEESYSPNSVSRILNDEMKIIDITNNYGKMSFNFGPTLLTWLEQHQPKVYDSILEADKLSLKRFNGHGSAMAQVYNHIIMPLANRRDKETQVIWGLRDFERRFGRQAEGMWLAETAVDTETLEVLAENGIKFTLLAPNQAKRFRKIGEETWTDGVDSRRAYLCNLPSGKSIHLFFYDGKRSQEVAFGGILKDGRRFAESLVSGFDETVSEGDPQLVHIATDGESYGHHHRHGDMALAYCMHYLETQELAQLTNYSEYLSLEPTTHEVEIHENSAWSCAHGVERWRSDCGCNTGGEAHWHQQWRAPLRESLNWLRDRLADIYELEMARYHPDPWALRNEYVKVPLKRSIDRAKAFLRAYLPDGLTANDENRIMALLEIQRQSLYMFTSCGWFFNEISGIEPVQILQYANRGIQLAEVYFGEKLEEHFLKRLAKAESNLAEYKNGRDIYETLVAPARQTLTQVGMHYAVRSIFTDDPEKLEVLNYICKSEEFERYNAGNQRLVMGRTKVQSKITLSEAKFSFVILYLGHHNVIGHTFEDLSPEEFRFFVGRVKKAFDHSNISGVIDLMRDFQRQESFSFFDMFKDEQIQLLEDILSQQLSQAHSSYKKINNRNYNLMNVMRASRLQVPKALRKNLEMVLANDLRELFSDSDRRVSTRKLKSRVQELDKWDIQLETEEFDFLCAHRLKRLAESLTVRKNRAEAVQNMQTVLEIIRKLGIDPELNEVQNIVFQWLKKSSTQDRETEFYQALMQFGKFVDLDVDVILARDVVASAV